MANCHMPDMQHALIHAAGAPPIAREHFGRGCLRLDLSSANPRLASLDPANPTAFQHWIDAECALVGAHWAAGGYGENRAVYGMSPLFGGAQSRSLHLGMDLWLPAGTEVFAVLDGQVHSMANNAQFGDYGPTVILEHELGGQSLFSLYGHLAARTLSHLSVGQRVAAGEQIAWLGTAEENLGWPPHLHLQLITEIGDYRGDYPGVCVPAEREQWLARCPDPALLLPELSDCHPAT